MSEPWAHGLRREIRCRFCWPQWAIDTDPGRHRDGEYYVDEAAAEAPLYFWRTFCRFPDGRASGKPLQFEPWQENEIIRPLFGWFRSDTGTRRFTKAFIFMARAGGKSTLAAAIGAYLMATRSEGEVLFAAGSMKQAEMAFRPVKQMVKASQHLAKKFVISRNFITRAGDRTAKAARVVAGGSHAHLQQGERYLCAIVDELHVHKNLDLINAFEMSLQKILHALLFTITTAGESLDSPCGIEYKRAQGVLSGEINDPSYLAVIKESDPALPWDSDEAIQQADPNFGVSCDPTEIYNQRESARTNDFLRRYFERYYLNRWVSVMDHWMSLQRWEACADPSLSIADFVGRECVAAFDLATKQDVCGMVLARKPAHKGEPVAILHYAWVPQNTIDARIKDEHLPYHAWAEQGIVYAVPGQVVESSDVRQKLYELVDMGVNVAMCRMDPWGASDFTAALQKTGVDRVTGEKFRHAFVCETVTQNYSGLGPGMKEFSDLVAKREIVHDGNPMLTSHVMNVIPMMDHVGNMKPDRKGAKKKIDLAVAGIMAVDGVGSCGQSVADQIEEYGFFGTPAT